MPISAIDRLIDFPSEIDLFFQDSPDARKEYLRAGLERNLRNARVFLVIIILSQVIVGTGRIVGDLGFPYYNLFVMIACTALIFALQWPHVGFRTTPLSMTLFSAWAVTFPFFIIRLGGYSAPTYPVYIIIILYILVFFHYTFPQYLFLFSITYLSNVCIFFLQPEIGLEEFAYRQIVMAIVVGVGIVGSYINVRTREKEFYSQFNLRRQKEELEKAYGRLEEAELQIVQSEKLASLGKMAAGMAHEINNPLGFISGNLDSLTSYFGDLKRLLDRYDKLTLSDNMRKEVDDLKRAIDYDYLVTDLDDALASSQRGADRIAVILDKLKHFSRLDEAKYKSIQIDECLESALSLVDTRGIPVHISFGATPEIQCMPALLNQVFHSVLENAMDAVRSRDADGEIWLSSRVEEAGSARRIVVVVSDNGCGMDSFTVEHVFDPFFTTKEVGKGQGLGLAVAHGIIAQHGGKIFCSSSPGVGTTFEIHLPAGFIPPK